MTANRTMQGFDGMLIPETKDIECQVLSDLINDPEIIATASGAINREMFSSEEYQRVWDIINKMSIEGKAIDFGTIRGLVDTEMLKNLISPKFGVSMGVTALQHCGVLAELATRRMIFLSCLDMMKRASTNTADYSELISLPGQLVEKIVNSSRVGKGCESISKILDKVAESIERNQISIQDGKRTRIPTGFDNLDKLTYSGFAPGNLVVLAGRPSIGKSAIMLQMVLAATRAGFPAAIYSLEMTKEELGQRLLYSTGLVTPAQIINNAMDWDAFERASGTFYGMPLTISDSPMTLDELCNNITLMHQRGKCDIAFIDYLGIIKPNNPKQTIYQATSEKTMKLKSLAKECGIPVVVLSQLNRESEKDKGLDNRAPQLYHLRESGCIEQDADIVLMLERMAENGTGNATLSDKVVNIWVRKNRQGKAGEICIRVTPNDTFTRFSDERLVVSSQII